MFPKVCRGRLAKSIRQLRAQNVGLLTVTILATLVGCSSVDNVGLITGARGDPGSLLTNNQSYTELGPVNGKACRYFLLGIIPWGDSTPSKAMENALASSEGDAVEGDALINASIETSLYGFIPLYQVFSFTCTTVKGVAIKFDPP